MSHAKVQSPARLVYHLALPALAVVLAYGIAFSRPLALQIVDAQLQLGKSNSAPGNDSPAQQLAAARTLERQLSAELAQLQSTHQRLIVQPMMSGQSVVDRVADLMSIFSGCGVHCLESSEHAETQHESADQFTCVQLRLSGSFQQMHQVMREIQAAPACISIQSLTMEPCPSNADGTHQWILIILV